MTDIRRVPAVASCGAHVGNVMASTSRVRRRMAPLPAFVGEAY